MDKFNLPILYPDLALFGIILLLNVTPSAKSFPV
nr:MAG TPA: hypothetical protein [Bacteriophage sp.]